MSADSEPSIAERVERLQTDAANEQVEMLLEIIEGLHTELQATRSELTSTQAELHNLKRDLRETGPSDSFDPEMTLDHRDEAIVKRLEREDDDEFSLSQRETIRKRLKRITRNGPLRLEDQTWHYTGIRRASQ